MAEIHTMEQPASGGMGKEVRHRQFIDLGGHSTYHIEKGAGEPLMQSHTLPQTRCILGLPKRTRRNERVITVPTVLR